MSVTLEFMNLLLNYTFNDNTWILLSDIFATAPLQRMIWREQYFCTNSINPHVQPLQLLTFHFPKSTQSAA